MLYTFSDNSFWLIGVQLLDGIGATTQGIGALLSGLTAGLIFDHYGYIVTFLTLGAAALVALVVFAVGMRETVNHE